MVLKSVRLFGLREIFLHGVPALAKSGLVAPQLLANSFPAQPMGIGCGRDIEGKGRADTLVSLWFQILRGLYGGNLHVRIVPGPGVGRWSMVELSGLLPQALPLRRCHLAGHHLTDKRRFDQG